MKQPLLVVLRSYSSNILNEAILTII